MFKLIFNVIFLGLVLSSKLSNFQQQSTKQICPVRARPRCRGFDCSSNAECFNSLLECVNNKCGRKVNVTCTQNVQCSSEYCSNGKCAPFPCSNFCPKTVKRCKDYCCRNDQDCNISDLGCFNNRCKRKNGIACSNDSDCGTNWCSKYSKCDDVPYWKSSQGDSSNSSSNESSTNTYSSSSNTGSSDPFNDFDVTSYL
jgi:hypothetical protein